jgi:hypothetical protein
MKPPDILIMKEKYVFCVTVTCFLFYIKLTLAGDVCMSFSTLHEMVVVIASTSSFQAVMLLIVENSKDINVGSSALAGMMSILGVTIVVTLDTCKYLGVFPYA